MTYRFDKKLSAIAAFATDSSFLHFASTLIRWGTEIAMSERDLNDASRELESLDWPATSLAMATAIDAKAEAIRRERTTLDRVEDRFVATTILARAFQREDALRLGSC